MATVKQVGSEKRKLSEDMANRIDKEVAKSKNLAPVRKNNRSNRGVQGGTASN